MRKITFHLRSSTNIEVKFKLVDQFVGLVRTPRESEGHNVRPNHMPHQARKIRQIKQDKISHRQAETEFITQATPGLPPPAYSLLNC